MADPRFIHLRVHTEYSLLEGAIRLKKLPGLCEAMEMPAVAVTDTNNLFAALEFSVTASGAGVQPIVPSPRERPDPPVSPSGPSRAVVAPPGRTDAARARRSDTDPGSGIPDPPGRHRRRLASRTRID